MPRIFRAIGDEFKSRLGRKDTTPVNRYEGFTGDGRVVPRDRRGTLKAEIPDVSTGLRGHDTQSPILTRAFDLQFRLSFSSRARNSLSGGERHDEADAVGPQAGARQETPLNRQRSARRSRQGA